MKSTSGRIFLTVTMILLISLLSIGLLLYTSIRKYLMENTFSQLQKDAEVVSELASACYTGGGLTSIEFLFNLNVVSQVSQSDAVICNSQGRILLCSDSPFGCEHRGL